MGKIPAQKDGAIDYLSMAFYGFYRFAFGVAPE